MLDATGKGSVTVTHPGGGKRELPEAYFDATVGRPFVVWGQVGGTYEVALTPKKFGQLVGGGGWIVDENSLDIWAKLRS